MSASPPSAAVRAPTQTESLVGVLSGGGRAFAAQFFSFYIRAPVKLFKPARFDYSMLLRHTVGQPPAVKNSWSESTPGLLWRAIKAHGIRFVPDRLLPPMIANSVVGAILYTAYLSSLSIVQFAQGNEHPTFGQAVFAGAFAGTAQAVVATPLDNLAIRFDSDVLRDKDVSLWKYSRDTLWKIGPRVAYGGVMLNVLKESSSFGIFFGVYEFFKGPVFRTYRNWWQSPGFFHPEGRPKSRVLYPSFVLVAGCAAACAVQLINYPMSKVQRLVTLRLQAIDAKQHGHQGLKNLIDQGWHFYAQVYHKTFLQVKSMAASESGGSVLRWLYSGAARYTLISMPGTSIGLLVFEILRIRFGTDV